MSPQILQMKVEQQKYGRRPTPSRASGSRQQPGRNIAHMTPSEIGQCLSRPQVVRKTVPQAWRCRSPMVRSLVLGTRRSELPVDLRVRVEVRWSFGGALAQRGCNRVMLPSLWKMSRCTRTLYPQPLDITQHRACRLLLMFMTYGKSGLTF
ncbi:hypothetical protein EYF80_018785 [Liparis tanakae]|uniref:Uncharacterized protein n=1 Tax=Liparis tanakae TaxID=230148 RepID=A0A4Z2HYN3_9TELE|nr:hypothetical protein EYF80_018785 [Liparis tanakae]